MDNIDWSNIKMAIWSEGLLTSALIEKIKARYPGITIFIHEQVVNGVNKMPSIYAHPDIADFDISFRKMSAKEQILVRCFSRHRLFDYCPESMHKDARRRELFLLFVVDALPGLLGPDKNMKERADCDPEESRTE